MDYYILYDDFFPSLDKIKISGNTQNGNNAKNPLPPKLIGDRGYIKEG